MDIIRLAPDADAPPDSDCIKISPLADGTFRLVTSALFEGDSDGDESVAVIGGETYRTFEEAEAAGKPGPTSRACRPSMSNGVTPRRHSDASRPSQRSA